MYQYPMPPAPLPSFKQPTVNAGLWLQDRLDLSAQKQNWVLMPALTAATPALRCAVEEFDTVTIQLQRRGMSIPTQARSAYQDLNWNGVSLRLYAAIWELPQTAEWVLLLVLGAQPDAIAPVGIRLEVRDDIQLLVDRELTETSDEAYLYAQVVGGWDEQFWVSIDMSNGVVTTLEFAFDPDVA